MGIKEAYREIEKVANKYALYIAKSNTYNAYQDGALDAYNHALSILKPECPEVKDEE